MWYRSSSQSFLILLVGRYWNRYPGARVDSPIPHYELSDPDLWSDWNWTQRFPGSAELRKYFGHVANKWDLRRDSIFGTWVDSAKWNESNSKWIVTTKDGPTFKASFFLPNTGFAAKRHIPHWKGIDTFAGTWVHPSYWPKIEPDLKGKKIAVIGTGTSCSCIKAGAHANVTFFAVPRFDRHPTCTVSRSSCIGVFPLPKDAESCTANETGRVHRQLSLIHI